MSARCIWTRNFIYRNELNCIGIGHWQRKSQIEKSLFKSLSTASLSRAKSQRVQEIIPSGEKSTTPVNFFSRYSASTIMTPHCKEFHFGSYDVIGFDLDLTLVRYNLKEMVKLIYDLTMGFLVKEKCYPTVLLDKKLDPDFLQKGLVLDIHRGNILKLSNSATILKATHGTRALSLEEICEIYGNKCQWSVAYQFFKDPLSTWNGCLSGQIRTLLDYFDYTISLVFGQAVDVLDAQSAKEGRACLKSYPVWPDILEGLSLFYSRENFSNGCSPFFEALRGHPEKYILPTSERVIKLLADLRSTGKALYMLTGSNCDFANFTASYVLGPDWRKYFDICVFFAKKPGFFTMQRPFLRCDEKLTEIPGSELSPSATLDSNASYLQGNWIQLRRTLAKKVNKSAECVRSLYVGDNLIQDVYTPVKHHDLEALAICEELLVEESHACKYDYAEFVDSKFWDSYFYVEGIPTMWAAVIDKYSQLCIPTIDCLAVEDPLNHKFYSKNAEGYYPESPKSYCG